MQVNADRKDYARDRCGIPVGGVRVAQLDVPLVRYGVDKTLCGGEEPRRKLIRIPLSPDALAAAYPGGKAEYLRRFDARLAQLVRQRWLLPEDSAAQRQAARRFAAQAFRR